MLEIETDQFGLCARSRAVVVDANGETVQAGNWQYPQGESAETYAAKQAKIVRGVAIPKRAEWTR
jgi:hypothetical protein